MSSTPEHDGPEAPLPRVEPSASDGGGAVRPWSAGRRLTVVGLVVLVPVTLVAMGVVAWRAMWRSAAMGAEEMQFRTLHSGMEIWAGTHRDWYPLPSRVDREHATLAEGEVKDLPRHIVSLMIYNGFYSVHTAISIVEQNPRITDDTGFEFVKPVMAADPANALWDPAFKAVAEDLPTRGAPAIGRGSAGAPGGFSYAMMPPVGAREAFWKRGNPSTRAILGNRGPAYEAVGSGASLTWALVPGGTPGAATKPGSQEIGEGSLSLQGWGDGRRWRGLTLFGDNHVEMSRGPTPPSSTFAFQGLSAASGPLPDNIFVNENDATRVKDGTNGITGPGLANTNNLLRHWTGGVIDPATGRLIDIPSQLWFD